MYGNNYGRVEPVKTVQERLKEQYEKAFKEPWNESSAEKLKTLKHVSIGSSYNNFYVSSSPTGHYSDKRLCVDDEVLRYLYMEVGARFDTLRIKSEIVEGIGGKEVPGMNMALGGKNILATTVVVDAGIEGLSELTFDYNQRSDEHRERCLAEAATIIRRSASTLRDLKCTMDGTQFVKMLPPEAALEKLDVTVSPYKNAPGWKLDDIVTILRAKAADIRINIQAKADSCENFEYTAHVADACRKLTLEPNNADAHLDEELKTLLNCVNAVCPHLDSLDVLLKGHVDADEGYTRDPFPGILDGRVAAYKKLFAAVPFNFPVKCHVYFTVVYEYGDAVYRKWNTAFIEHFKKEYKNVTESKWERCYGPNPDYDLRGHEAQMADYYGWDDGDYNDYETGDYYDYD
ncbi:hypothetical protein AAVH_17757 [Aphelenchoides avenae]|nr:hypothetical protein AAVH_17757 [Aphelenchus avenae]